MVIKPFGLIIACFGFLFINQTVLPKAMAMRKSPSVDEFMIEDQRTHRRQNYVVQRALDDEILGNIDNIGPAYVTEPFEPDTSPEELPALIVDYANMIRNDIILLDNSVETRTRKRGNIKKSNEKNISLGVNFIPEKVTHRYCSENSCPEHYGCALSYYNITVLEKMTKVTEVSLTKLPHEFGRWITSQIRVPIACECTKNVTN